MEKVDTIKLLVNNFIDNHLELHKRLNEQNLNVEETFSVELSNFDKWFTPALENIGKHYFENDFNKRLIVELLKNDAFQKCVKESKYLKQSIDKPYGYAGDFQMMEIIYENGYEGQTPFGKFYNKAITIVSSCDEVRHRRKFLKSQLLDSQGDCLSVAAGPGREIIDAYAAGFTGSVTAIDADIDALRHFNKLKQPKLNADYWIGNIFHLLKGKYTLVKPKNFHFNSANPNNDFSGWHSLFGLLLYKRTDFRKKKYDLIYSAGLLDYVTTFNDNFKKGSIGLTKLLFDQLKPGGKLIIGVMTTEMPKGQQFFMEAVCEWTIIFRDEAELRSFTQAIPDRQIDNIDTVKGYHGIQNYLIINKSSN